MKRNYPLTGMWLVVAGSAMIVAGCKATHHPYFEGVAASAGGGQGGGVAGQPNGGEISGGRGGQPSTPVAGAGTENGSGGTSFAQAGATSGGSSGQGTDAAAGSGPGGTSFAQAGSAGTSETGTGGNSPVALGITTSTLPVGHYNSPYSVTLMTQGGSGEGYQYSVASGALPGGITLSQSGVLSGVATAGGSFAFRVAVVDSAGAKAEVDLSIHVVRKRWVAFHTGPADSQSTVATTMYLLDLAATSPAAGSAGMPAILTGTAAADLTVQDYQFAPDGSSLGIRLTDNTQQSIYLVRLGNNGAVPSAPLLVHQSAASASNQWGFFPDSSHLYWLDVPSSTAKVLGSAPVPTTETAPTPVQLATGDIYQVQLAASGWLCWSMTGGTDIQCVKQGMPSLSDVKTIATGADAGKNIGLYATGSPVFTLTMWFAGTQIRRFVNVDSGSLLADGSNSSHRGVSIDGNWFVQGKYISASSSVAQIFPITSAVTPAIELARNATFFAWSGTGRYVLASSGPDASGITQPASIVDFVGTTPVETALPGAVGTTLALSPDATWVSLQSSGTLSVEQPFPTPPAAPSTLSTTANGSAFSPDSKYLVYAATVTSPSGVDAYLTSLGSGGTVNTALVHPSSPPRPAGSNVGLPAWSADSAYLGYLYTSEPYSCIVGGGNMTGASCQNKDLYTVSLYGTNKGVPALTFTCGTKVDCQSVLGLKMQP